MGETGEHAKLRAWTVLRALPHLDRRRGAFFLCLQGPHWGLARGGLAEKGRCGQTCEWLLGRSGQRVSGTTANGAVACLCIADSCTTGDTCRHWTVDRSSSCG